MILPNVRKLATEKMGLAFDGVQTHPLANMLMPTEPLSKEESSFLQESTDQVYQTFLERVAEGRNMTIDDVHQVAQGRVWTGEKALELGLVDSLGNLEDAIALAAEAADLSDYKLKAYPFKKETLLDKLVQGLMESEDLGGTMQLKDQEIRSLKLFNDARQIIADPSPQARLPFQIKYY